MTMRAVVLQGQGGYDQLVLKEVPVPKPKRDEVLLKVAACGVGSHDIALRNGDLRRGFEPGMIIGGEISGQVVELGSEVDGFAVGDNVTCKVLVSCRHCWYCIRGEETSCVKVYHTEGGYAEYCALPAECLVKLPPDMDVVSACIFGGAIGTALHAVRELGHCRLGDNVLVTGSGGGVGLHAIQIAKMSGGRVIAATTTPSKADILKEAGADVILPISGDRWFQQVMELTDGRGADLIIDNVGSAVFTPAFRSMAVKARYIFIGQLYRDTITINPAFIFRKGAQMFGVHSFSKYMVEDVVELVHQGKIRPYLNATAPLEKAGWLHEQIEARKVVGRAAIVPNA